MNFNPCLECSRLSPFCYKNCDVAVADICDQHSAFESVYGDSEEYYDYKWFPTLSRYPFSEDPSSICDFCANDILCKNCMFGV